MAPAECGVVSSGEFKQASAASISRSLGHSVVTQTPDSPRIGSVRWRLEDASVRDQKMSSSSSSQPPCFCMPAEATNGSVT